MNYPPREKFNTSTLEVRLVSGVLLTFQAKGYVTKKERRTILLAILKAIKEEVKFVRSGIFYHDDSSMMRGLEDRFKPASVYQAPSLKTSAQKFGYQIRIKRNELGFTQGQLSKRTGIHRAYLSRIERGHHHLHPQEQQRILEILTELKLMNSTEDSQ